MSSRKFTELRVWQVAHQLSPRIYRTTKSYPREELYGLVSQMRRAAVSIAANIAEGFGRCTPRGHAHFYEIAKSSAEELRHSLILSVDLGYIDSDPALEESVDSVCAMLYRLRQSVLGESDALS